MPISSDSIGIRPLSTDAELTAAVALQHDTWGRDFTETVPASLMKVSQQVGAVAAGAFTPEGGLVGFVFGVSGFRRGVPSHWSHMLAVVPEGRGLGLGRRLKEYQRDRVREQGVRTMYWTFDPLVVRNANLNMNCLGAEPKRFVPDFYSTEHDDEFHSVFGTDRYITVWNLDRGAAPPRVVEPGSLPIVNTNKSGDPITDLESSLPDEPEVLVEVPADITTLRQTALDRATAWRESTQRAFLGYQALGYRVGAFIQEAERFFYLLEHTPS